jgi:hypothetical protein
VFHIIIYFSYVGALQGNAFDPTWLIKFLMALYNLWGLRRTRCLWEKWNVGRLGVLKREKIPENWKIDSLWCDWSRDALQNFRWCDTGDMWKVLGMRTTAEAIPDTQAHGAVSETQQAEPMLHGHGLPHT